MKIALIDYGLGNLFSVSRALQAVRADFYLAKTGEQIQRADKLVLPGVGAFADGMKGLTQSKLAGPIRENVASGKPILGVCLGMQLMMETGNEFGSHKGLGIIKGTVDRLETTEKLPQIGWNKVIKPKQTSWNETIFSEIESGSYFYFVHSFVCRPKDKKMILATTDYGNGFCSAFHYNHVYGVQFHPEKSSDIGLKLYENFVAKA